MKMFVCALLVGVMAVVRPAHADTESDARAAAAVFASMHDDLERCFTTTRANAFVMIEALLDPLGHVRAVDAFGDARATITTRRCVEKRVARATFPAPRGGGTSRVRVSLVFAFDG